MPKQGVSSIILAENLCCSFFLVVLRRQFYPFAWSHNNFAPFSLLPICAMSAFYLDGLQIKIEFPFSFTAGQVHRFMWGKCGIFSLSALAAHVPHVHCSIICGCNARRFYSRIGVMFARSLSVNDMRGQFFIKDFDITLYHTLKSNLWSGINLIGQ